MRFTKQHAVMAMDYIRKNITNPITLEPVTRIQSKARKELIAHYLNKYPQDDMKVLLKYGKASNIETIRIHSTQGVMGYLEINDINVYSPASYPDENLKTYLYLDSFRGEKLQSIMQELNKAWLLHTGIIKELHNKYAVLFNNVTTFKQLMELWPECSIVFPRCMEKKQCASLIAISKDELDWIKKDSTKRLKEKK